MSTRRGGYGRCHGRPVPSYTLHSINPDGSDLICIDSGAAFGGYGADITRTIPASGTFTKRQTEIYSIVLKAMNAAINAVKPGATLAQIDKIARAVITKAGRPLSLAAGAFLKHLRH